MKKIDIKVQKVDPNAIIPSFAHPTDSGFDLYSCKDVKIRPHQTVIVPTGLRFEIPYGWGVQIKNKSGITVKGVPVYTKRYNEEFEEQLINEGERSPITVFEGTIDMDYRGEIGLMVRNDSDKSIIIPSNIKIAQGVIREIITCNFVEIQEVDTNTTRGEGGYGSTGIK